MNDKKIIFDMIVENYNKIYDSIINIQYEIADILSLQNKKIDTQQDNKLINLLKTINSNLSEIYETAMYNFNNLCYHQNNQIDIPTFKDKMIKIHNELMKGRESFCVNYKNLKLIFNENNHSQKYNESIKKLITTLESYRKTSEDSLFKLYHWTYSYN